MKIPTHKQSCQDLLSMQEMSVELENRLWQKVGSFIWKLIRFIFYNFIQNKVY